MVAGEHRHRARPGAANGDHNPPDTRLAEINEAAAATGDDPELHTLLLRPTPAAAREGRHHLPPPPPPAWGEKHTQVPPPAWRFITLYDVNVLLPVAGPLARRLTRRTLRGDGFDRRPSPEFSPIPPGAGQSHESCGHH